MSDIAVGGVLRCGGDRRNVAVVGNARIPVAVPLRESFPSGFQRSALFDRGIPIAGPGRMRIQSGQRSPADRHHNEADVREGENQRA